MLNELNTVAMYVVILHKYFYMMQGYFPAIF